MDAVTADLNRYLAELDEKDRIEAYIEGRTLLYMEEKGMAEPEAKRHAERDYANITCYKCFDKGCPKCDEDYARMAGRRVYGRV